MTEKTVVHLLAEATLAMPDQPALVCGDELLTYRGYAASAAAFARDLAERGVGRGQRIAVILPNCIDLVIAVLGAQAAGIQVASLNPDYTAAELAPILQDASPSLVVVGAEVAARLGATLQAIGLAIEVLGPGARRLATETADPSDLPLPHPEDLAVLQYTGGTTGRAKGVNLTHAAIAANIRQRDSVVPMRWGVERILAITPLFHVYAVSMGIHMALASQGTLVILPRYRPDWTLEALNNHRITVMLGSPTIYAGLLGYDDLAAADFSHLEVSISGSAALPEEILARWERQTGSRILEGYGQTESGPVLSFNPRDGRGKEGSVGLVVPETDVQIVDLATGEVLIAPGSVGEIRARGPQLMQGYRNLPTETAEALRDGWLYTGDIGEFDAEGYLYIRGRRKEMVIVGGFNVYPREVEEVLFTHPDVADAVVVGVPDSYRGEVLVALVVPAREGLTEAALATHLAERLVKYKWPSRILLRGDLPKTTVGKVDKVKIREELLA